MGKRGHSNNGVPRSSRGAANKEVRQGWEKHAFAMFRPVSPKSSDVLFSLAMKLQQEEDIPADVTLYNTDLHSSLIQERRMRRGLATGVAAAFMAGAALAQLEHGVPHNSQVIPFFFKGVDVIGRNRNILIARIGDEKRILSKQRAAMTHILGGMGLKMDIDRCDHITLGESEQGMSATEKKHVIHVMDEVFTDVTGDLLPIMVEHLGQRTPLSNGMRQKVDEIYQPEVA